MINPDDNLIGKTEGEARVLAEAKGARIRVVNVEGEELAGTCDYCTDRINVTIVDKIVTATYRG